MGISLSELVRVLEPLGVEGALDREVAGIAFDSRRVFPGMMFVAMRGRHCDGHEHISAAVDRGACAIICERNGFVSKRAAKIKVADSRAALARAAAAFYGNPSQGLNVIGVTGTNGKTSVAFLIQHLLRACEQRVGLISTIRYEVGSRTIPAERTTPEAVEVQSLLAQMNRGGCGTCVLEVSSHALDQCRVDQVEFDAGVFTNLTHDHLDYHGSFESYYLAKRRLFELLPRRGKKSTAVVNQDDPAGRKLLSECRDLRRISYGFGPGSDVRGTAVRLDANGSVLRIDSPWGAVTARIPLIGRFNLANALAAVATCLTTGWPLDRLGEALGSAPQVPGRLQRVEAGQPFEVLVDYAHTEDALGHVLATLREITSGCLRVVFGCGGARDSAKRAAMGRVAGMLADAVWVTTDNPRGESSSSIADAVVAGLREAGRASWEVELDRARAIEEAIRGARPGDTVLVAGKGHETFQEFADTVVPFDDRQQLLEALVGLGGGVWRANATW